MHKLNPYYGRMVVGSVRVDGARHVSGGVYNHLLCTQALSEGLLVHKSVHALGAGTQQVSPHRPGLDSLWKINLFHALHTHLLLPLLFITLPIKIVIQAWNTAINDDDEWEVRSLGV